MNKRSLILGIILAAILFALFLWQLDWQQLRQVLKRPNVSMLLLGLAHGFGVYAFRGLRWLILLRAVGHVTLHSSFWGNSVGFGINSLLPGRLGEFARALLVARRHRLTVGPVLATVVFERIIDLVFASLIFFLYVLMPSRLFSGELGEEHHILFKAMFRGTLTILILIMAGILTLFLLSRRLHDSSSRKLPLSGWIRRIYQFFIHFALTFRQFARLRLLVLYISVTVLFWLYVMIGYALHALSFHIHLPFLALPWINVLVMMGASLPTPGSVGGYHWSFRLGLTLFYGIDKDPASAAALWSHLCMVVPAIILTIYYMVRHHVHLSELARPVAIDDTPVPDLPPEEQDKHPPHHTE